MEIVWKYQYVPEGQLEPDEFNRWAVMGFIKVPVDILPQYKAISDTLNLEYHLITIALIEQKGSGYVPSTKDRFCCNVFSALECGNLGLSKWNVFGNTVEEVKIKAEEHLNKFQEVIKGAL